MAINFSAIKQILTSPRSFYESAKEETFGPSLIFLLTHFVITSIISTIIQIPVFLRDPLLGAFAIIGTVFGIVIGVIFLTIVVFIVAAILHLSTKIVGGKTAMVNSFKVVAYAAAAFMYVNIIFTILQVVFTLSGITLIDPAAGGSLESILAAAIGVLALYGVLITALTIWTWWVEGTGVSVYNQISTGRGVAAVVITTIIIVAVFVVPMLLLLGTIAALAGTGGL